MRRAVVLAASVVNCVSAAEDWFVTPACSDANGDDNKVPSYRADMETCTTLGRCTDPAADNVQESECTGTGATWSAYTVDNVGFLDPATADSVSLGASTPPGWTGATRFPRAGDADAGASCWALEGPPEQPTYKLPMCKMYNENACCAPIHDAETQWAYETLVNVADRCLQYVNEEHFALREFFCIACDPEQNKYMSMTEDDDDNWGEIRICKSFADRVWSQGGKDYDRCGFMIFTGGPFAGPESKNEIVPYGDNAPDTADDPILPSKFWQDESWRGTQVEQFFNQIKPGMLDNFDFRVIDDTGDNAELVREHCFHGAGGAALTLPRMAVLAVAAVLGSMYL